MAERPQDLGTKGLTDDFLVFGSATGRVAVPDGWHSRLNASFRIKGGNLRFAQVVSAATHHHGFAIDIGFLDK